MAASTPVALLAFLHAAVVASCLLVGATYYVTYRYGPENYPAFEGPTGKEPHGLAECEASTENIEDLVVDGSLDGGGMKELVGRHGAAIVEDILSPETAARLREYILKANHEIENTYVHEQENRYRIMISHENPLVRAALKEVATHPVLRPLLDAALGPSSSLVSMSAITNVHGAAEQHFHADTHTSAATHPEYFVPEFQLGIPLQNTTAEMGATEVCPGTHRCSGLKLDWEEYYHRFMREEYPEEEDYEVDIEDGEYEEWLSYQGCEMVPSLRAGSGLLFDTDTIHRGGAHVDPDAPERVVVFLAFAGSRRGKDDGRSLPFGKVHSLHWRSWGLTVDDLGALDARPSRWWHAFGLRFFDRNNGVRPWCIQDIFFESLFRLPGHPSAKVYMIGNDFTLESLQLLVEQWIYIAFAAAVVYLGIIPFAWLLVVRRKSSANDTAVGKNGVAGEKKSTFLSKLLASLEAKDCCEKGGVYKDVPTSGSDDKQTESNDDNQSDDDSGSSLHPATPTRGRGSDPNIMDRPKDGSIRKGAAFAMILVGALAAFSWNYSSSRIEELVAKAAASERDAAHYRWRYKDLLSKLEELEREREASERRSAIDAGKRRVVQLREEMHRAEERRRVDEEGEMARIQDAAARIAEEAEKLPSSSATDESSGEDDEEYRAVGAEPLPTEAKIDELVRSEMAEIESKKGDASGVVANDLDLSVKSLPIQEPRRVWQLFETGISYIIAEL